VKYTCSLETVQQNGRFTLFSSKFLSIYSILYVFNTVCTCNTFSTPGFIVNKFKINPYFPTFRLEIRAAREERITKNMKIGNKLNVKILWYLLYNKIPPCKFGFSFLQEWKKATLPNTMGEMFILGDGCIIS